MQYPAIAIEQWENYTKKSYRNRCCIFGANGLLSISIPVIKATHKKVLSKNVKIAYDTNWQKLHKKSIESAYRSSPYYEYYLDDLDRFFTQKWTYLLDFNLEIHDQICHFLEIDNNYSLTQNFISMDSIDFDDFRNQIHPKNKTKQVHSEFFFKPYTQVFGDKHGFIHNLSILDLIFNLGPNASPYLLSCRKN